MLLLMLRHLVQNPLSELGDSGAHARKVGLRAPNAPADDAAQEISAVIALDHEGAARIALKNVNHIF